MKKTLILLLTTISLNILSQDIYEIDIKAIEHKEIIYTADAYFYLELKLAGLIELNGVIFKNDTCQCPVMYKATIDKVELYNECTNKMYSFETLIDFGGKKIISISEGVNITIPDFMYFPNESGITTVPGMIDTRLLYIWPTDTIKAY